MRLRYRLTLLIGLAALLPLLFTAFAASKIANEHHLSQTRELYGKQSESLAVYSYAWFDSHLKGLSLATGLFDLSQLSQEEQEGLLQLAYRQFDAVNIALMANSAGDVVAGPVRATNLGDVAGGLLEGHQLVSSVRLQEFIERVPLFSGGSAGGSTAVGQAYLPEGASSPVLPVSIRSASDDTLMVAVELSLGELEEQFRVQGEGGVAAVLLNGENVMVGEGGLLVNPRTTALFSEGLEGELTYELEDGTAVLAAFSSVPGFPWRVVVAVPESVATQAGRAIQARTSFMYLLAIVLAASMGILGARQMARPVVKLKEAAFEVAKGRLGHRVEPEGSREVVELARAFNFMSRRLEQDQREIDEKNAEIQAFNNELQERVEERTRDLKESQERLVESSRMAAVAEMGAGLAHELNNPVAGILGLSQLAKMKGGADPKTLESIEEQAQRCRNILSTLSRFTSRERGEKLPVDLAEVCSNVVGLSAGVFSDAGLTLANEVEGPIRVRLDAAFFGQALSQLLKSLRAELEPSGVVRLQCEIDDTEVCLKVSLEGQLRPRGDDWLATGMGFWVARYAVREHGGQLEEFEDVVRAVHIRLPLGDA